ncbi:MAG: T9SS type A sorting domain-containing protein [bacterium]|nr:T9SS type A sorting domain-containing protein [bacterium]
MTDNLSFRNLLLALSLTLSTIASSQTTSFYKNIFGAYGNLNFQDAPLINGMFELDNNEYFVTSAHNPAADYYLCAKLDSNFNIIWVNSYNDIGSGPTEMFSHAAQLTDGSIIATGISEDKRTFTKFDPNGAVEFTKFYYGTGPNDSYSADAVCTSAEDDTSYVTMFAQCSVQFGLFKFDKDGEIIWGHEFNINGPFLGSIYDLSLALNDGYITRGNYDGATVTRGLIMVANNDGTMKVCKEYESSDPTVDFVTPSKVYTSHMDDSYYIPINYVSNNYYESGRMMRLDSNLNIINAWHFTHSTPGTNMRLRNIANTTDGHLIINGEIYNPNNYPTYQFFVMRFDPNATSNNIIWAKEFKAISSDQYWHSTYAVKGLKVNPYNNQIIMPMSAHRDGSSVLSMDENASDMCNMLDINVTATEIQDLSALTGQLTYMNEPTSSGDLILSPRDAGHSDTTLCGVDPSIHLGVDTETEIIKILADVNQTGLQNLTNEPLELTIITMQGQTIARYSLQPFEKQALLELPSGVYIYRAKQGYKYQDGKIQVY